MQNINFLLVGVGGQGVLTASNILATAGMLAGYDVKKSEIHGMSQRGGNVSSHIRWGETVFSPLSAMAKPIICWHLKRWKRLDIPRC